MIAPTNTLSPEWQNENELRSYPLADDSKAAEVLPTWLLADLRVTVDKAYAVVFLSSAYVSDTIVSVGISGVRTYVEDGVTKFKPPEGLLTKTVTRDELEPLHAYSMDRMYGSASGSITFGNPPHDATPFRYAFTHEEAPFVSSAVIRVTPPGVTRIIDADHGLSADGVIDLSGNNEFRTYVDPDDATGHTIVIELTDMYRDITTSVCQSAPSFNACGRTPVKTVSGVRPDNTGKITLRFR